MRDHELSGDEEWTRCNTIQIINFVVLVNRWVKVVLWNFGIMPFYKLSNWNTLRNNQKFGVDQKFSIYFYSTLISRTLIHGYLGIGYWFADHRDLKLSRIIWYKKFKGISLWRVGLLWSKSKYDENINPYVKYIIPPVKYIKKQAADTEQKQ